MKKPDPNNPIKVAIADDHALFRAGVKKEAKAEADKNQESREKHSGQGRESYAR